MRNKKFPKEGQVPSLQIAIIIIQQTPLKRMLS
jgi:hypothetical protein